MKAENCKLSGTEEEFSLSSWTNESSIEKRVQSLHTKQIEPQHQKKKQASKPPREQSREVSEKHEKKNAKKERRNSFSWNLSQSKRIFCFIYFAIVDEVGSVWVNVPDEKEWMKLEIGKFERSIASQTKPKCCSTECFSFVKFLDWKKCKDQNNRAIETWSDEHRFESERLIKIERKKNNENVSSNSRRFSSTV